MAQRVKHLPAMQETRVWSLCGEDPLEKEMATHSSILAWKTPWMEKPGSLQSVGLQRVRNDCATSLSLSSHRSCTIYSSWLRIVCFGRNPNQGSVLFHSSKMKFSWIYTQMSKLKFNAKEIHGKEYPCSLGVSKNG